MSTDKVDAEVPAPVAGRIAKIHAAEGDTIAVGAPLAEIATGDGDGATPSEGPSAQETRPEPPAESQPAISDHAGNGGAPEAAPRVAEPDEQVKTVDIVTPTGGESVTEGTILEWTVKAGGSVKEGDTVVVVSTDKVDMELPAPASGVVSEILSEEGETVTVGQVIGRMRIGAGAEQPAATAEHVHAEAREQDAATERAATEPVFAAEPDTPAEPERAAEPPAEPEGAAESQRAAEPERPAEPERADEPVEAEAGHVSPIARRIAARQGIDLSKVEGSARGGRITKADVLAAAGDGAGVSTEEAPAPADTTAPPEARSPTAAGAQLLRGGAAALARYMEQSRSVPTATSFRTFPVTVLEQRRAQLKDAGQRVSFTHLIAYAIAIAATDDMPVMANHFAEIDGQPHRVDDGACNLGVAVDVEKKDGSRALFVPVIRGAGRMRFGEFVQAYNALIEKARAGGLTADELSGGNVTLTNPGGIGTVASVPRLMAGQGTIVATGAIGYPPGLDRLGSEIGAEKVMTMTSTYDHRVIQGAESGRFLQRIEGYLRGDEGFYERVFADLAVELPKLPAPALAPSPAAPRPPVPSFKPLPEGAPAAAPPDEEMLEAVQAATSLVKAHRTHGHLAAKLDPLGREPEGDPALDPAPLGLTKVVMSRIPARILRMYVPGKTLAEALPHLRETYCGPIAYEIEHIASHEQRLWLREKIEGGTFRKPLSTEEQKALLRRLTEVDALERFMHKAYLGQKQFSIEGLDMTVPMLDELIRLAAGQGAREVVIGMAHRGRLNVLAHNLGRPYDSIFAEFEGSSTLAPITSLPHGGTGDVKYHHGADGSYGLPSGESITVRLESNPSHLEFVDPVVVGATRAAQTRRQGAHAHQDVNAAIPVILHGDAAFPAQGVVAETLNLQALDGYTVGGTIHIIQNNQVGFTTDPDDARSTKWASDLAKGFDVPIIHVNADDVPACISALRLAFAFRQRFGHDVLIDLIGYRRFGHNEADEPAYTQPEMYQAIKKHPPVRELFARQLIEQGVVTEQESTEMTDNVWSVLSEAHQELKEQIERAKEVEHGTGEYQLDRSASPEVSTAVPADRLRVLNEELLSVPEGFTVHPKLVKQLEQRRAAFAQDGAGGGEQDGVPGIVWAQAEELAFASLLTEGIPIRLTGQDTERGTFSQRHLVLHDAKTGQEYYAMAHLPGARAPMELHNSPLSEMACVGFEYGYSQEAPETLVLWEAQFGDFANAAQVIIDQFITSGLAKWGQTSRLVLLLPHGYEGSGPEHSSARLERFLQLAAEGSIRVADCTTPAQYFHLLRRQARIAKQRPLVIMTPKRLLRLKQATSRVQELAQGRFEPVLAEPGIDPEQVTRLLLCSGKIYYDLTGHRAHKDNAGVAVGRVELLYPFPQAEILRLVASYPRLHEVVWVQEEPRNMGARAHMSPRLLQTLPAHLHFGYVGRPERAASGEGYPLAHANEQNRIVSTALDLRQPVSQYPREQPGER
ncbi:MAG: multifunctional oxoglutarate decarboxylase/oxoglutarate dehydrogenase thiamine pyrophosphate-binding subunit/dihydrolipoyllysine-residue succinyltransferase subunit [Solirubrobacterales bacterium]|nr:multifunctional oxoglutarate decarboxylase/oxoglutarate dehydrogenase thiamine pyrophosphate-binding subunit/dihydrolipoyllysine-residue succinyltransferase subunit [Solirubrobacterales bacterium]